jgi:hypothetical protein
MVVAVLVTLTSIPMLAAVLAGAASLTTTSDPRSPVVADASPAPVVVPGHGDAGLSTAPPPVGAAPTPAAVPTPTSAGGDGATVPGDTVTVGPQSRLHADSTGVGGSTSHTSPTWQKPPSNPGGSRPLPAPSSPPKPPPGTPPITAPIVPPIVPPITVPSVPSEPSPSPSGLVSGLIGAVGGLLGVGALISVR